MLTKTTPLAGPSQKNNDTTQLGAGYPAIVDCGGYFPTSHLLATLDNVKAAINQGLVEIDGSTVLSPDADKRTKAAFKQRTYIKFLVERLEEMQSFNHVSGLKPDRSELQQPHLACVTPLSGQKYAYLDLGYDPMARCDAIRDLTAFSAADTAYIFLCPRFWNVSPSGITDRCPSVENNQFVGDEDYFFLDSQLYQLIAQLHAFYLEGNAVTKARLDWNGCILDLTAKESVLISQNVALWTFCMYALRLWRRPVVPMLTIACVTIWQWSTTNVPTYLSRKESLTVNQARVRRHPGVLHPINAGIRSKAIALCNHVHNSDLLVKAMMYRLCLDRSIFVEFPDPDEISLEDVPLIEKASFVS
ncbi:MAG: hypothetical protein Q9220_002294 [cf. Caloplaca sp. 1 TL-2023]